MDAQPELALIARALKDAGLDAVLIGNMAAAIHGAPVSTVDIDFFFRSTPRNLQRLRQVARAIDAVILRPYYPASSLFRLQRDSDGLQIDFMGRIDGARSFEGVRNRSTEFSARGIVLRVASLADIVKSKRAAGRPKDRAVLDILEKTIHEEASTTPGPSKPPRSRK